MKKLLLLSVFVLTSLVSFAQFSGTKVTKVVASTATTGTVVLSDTTGTGHNLPVRRGDYTFQVVGTTASTAILKIYSKSDPKNPLAQWFINAIYVLGAGGNPSTQTLTQKITYLNANTY